MPCRTLPAQNMPQHMHGQAAIVAMRAVGAPYSEVRALYARGCHAVSPASPTDPPLPDLRTPTAGTRVINDSILSFVSESIF